MLVSYIYYNLVFNYFRLLNIRLFGVNLECSSILSVNIFPTLTWSSTEEGGRSKVRSHNWTLALGSTSPVAVNNIASQLFFIGDTNAIRLILIVMKVLHSQYESHQLTKNYRHTSLLSRSITPSLTNLCSFYHILYFLHLSRIL